MKTTKFPAQAVLELWFEDALTHPEHITKVKKRWFNSTASFDAQLRKDYAHWLEPIAAATGWRGSAHERLARVLLLDQFSRNIHRRTPDAFAYDHAAVALMRTGLNAGQDTELPPVARGFFYMPLQHAENNTLQEESVQRFGSLVPEARNETERRLVQSNLRYARLHAEIIQRYGRFPHRNAILGRDSTNEEVEYLAGNAPHFGQ